MLLVALLLAAPSVAKAEVLRERYPYTLELSGGLALGADFDAAGTSLLGGFGRLEFYGPVASEVQVGGGLWLDPSGELVLLVGLRQFTTLDRWQTRLDLQLAGSAGGGLAVGPRVGAGVGYELFDSWRVGAGVGAAFFVGRVRVLGDAGLLLSHSW